MFQGLGGWHLVVILFIILLLFGAPKLPGLAKSLGQSMRILKKEVRTDQNGAADTADAEGSAKNESAASTDGAANTNSTANTDSDSNQRGDGEKS